MPSQQKKIPFPGDGAIVKAGLYQMGLSRDRSGIEQIDSWATTATPQELDWLLGPVGADGKRQDKKGYAYSLGFVVGLGTMPLWAKFWSWFFG
jgi:hypothetical protein